MAGGKPSSMSFWFILLALGLDSFWLPGDLQVVDNFPGVHHSRRLNFHYGPFVRTSLWQRQCRSWWNLEEAAICKGCAHCMPFGCRDSCGDGLLGANIWVSLLVSLWDRSCLTKLMGRGAHHLGEQISD